jgi:hypothetical protein
MFSHEPEPVESSTLETKVMLKNEDVSILGIYMRKSDEPLLIAIETFDNQIDFNELIMGEDDEGDFDYSLRQLQEIVPRSNFSQADPIIKCDVVFQEDFDDNLI